MTDEEREEMVRIYKAANGKYICCHCKSLENCDILKKSKDELSDYDIDFKRSSYNGKPFEYICWCECFECNPGWLFHQYLCTKAWKEKESERFKIDGYICQKCGSAKNLMAHHLNYSRLCIEDVNHDLVTLCQDCHNELHKKDIEKKKKNGRI